MRTRLTPQSRADGPEAPRLLLHRSGPPLISNVRCRVDEATKFSVFMTIWIAFGVGSFVWEKKATPSEKGRLLPHLTWIGGLLFGAGTLWLFPTWEAAAFLVPSIALISWVNAKLMRVCGSCGKLIYPTELARPKYCSKCGSTLT